MTILNPPQTTDAVAIKAQTVEEQALHINAALNKMTTTIAGIWDLEPTKDEIPKTTFLPHKNPGAESVIEGDSRTLVDPEHFMPNGKYRSIVKLFIKYENLGANVFAHGTGWLIRPDVMITAGHNVYAWSKSAGKACEIKVYAGYNGAASISDPTVEFRKAKRVVTTSQWLSNRGSLAHDFALIQVDRPFTNVKPIPYIETPPKDKQRLGVVGYPADKIDNGEKGGKMYELFEETDYNIMTQKDTMLAHYIDSEGGNSGGPILREFDLVGIATHVYGGEQNTASVLGRYGNPVQDYLAAMELPLATPGKINLVPVSSDNVNQEDAATGPQVKEIAKLGDNVVDAIDGSVGRNSDKGTATDKAEFWIFEGVEEIIDLTRDFANTVGPVIGNAVGTAVAPMIAQQIRIAQNLQSTVEDVSDAVSRTILANTTLVIAEARAVREEGLFDTIVGVVKTALPGVQPGIGPTGIPVVRLPFEDIMRKVGVQAVATQRLVNDVTAEVARALILGSQTGPINTERMKPESSLKAPEHETASANEVAFMQELSRVLEGDKAEGMFDVIKTAARVAGGVLKKGISDINARLGPDMEENALDTDKDVLMESSGDPPQKELNSSSLALADEFKTDVIKSLEQRPLYKALCTSSKAENTFSGSDDVRKFDLLTSVIAQALILHSVVADVFLTHQMSRPVAELKAEGFFDDVKGFFGEKENVIGVAADVAVAAGPTFAFPVVGQIVGAGLMTVSIANRFAKYKEKQGQK